MKFAAGAVFGLSLVFVDPALAAAPAPAEQAAATSPAHIKAVQDLLSAMQAEKLLRGVAARSHYQSEAQRQSVFAKLDKTSPAEVYQRLAPPLAHAISANTALEMTRFYNTPYGKQVIDRKYNSRAQIIIPGMTPAVPPEEKQARKRAAYVVASQELADAEPVIEHEAFHLLQQINTERR